MRPFTVLVAAIATFTAAGCSDGSSAQTTQTTTSKTEPSTTTASRKTRPSGPVLGTAKSRFGRILVDQNGLTLYLFTADKAKGKSKCFGACAKAWPPYLSKEPVSAGKGVDQDLLGSTARKDGRVSQVTYRGHPLYYYVGEKNPGEIFCQAVSEFGGFWYIVAPSGKAIRTPAS